ncbi:MAG: AI-2E family transporter, partial [Bdellovibrionales bacterium]
EEGLSRIANIVVQLSTAIVYRIPSALLALFIFCAALYFFLAEARMLRQVFERQGLLSKEETRSLIHVLQRCCFSTVVTSVLIAVIQATIVGVGAIFTKAGDFTVVWLMTFFASFIPVIGAGPVALFLALYKAVLNDFGQAIVLVIIAVIAGTSDNLLRPYLIATGEADLHPIVSLLAIIGALLIFGMPGLFLGPVIAMVAMKIVPTLYHTPREVTIEDSDPEKTKTLTTPKTR